MARQTTRFRSSIQRLEDEMMRLPEAATSTMTQHQIHLTLGQELAEQTEEIEDDWMGAQEFRDSLLSRVWAALRKWIFSPSFQCQVYP